MQVCQYASMQICKIARSCQPIKVKYDLRYLGVQLSSNLSFSIRIENTVSASRGRKVMLTLLKSLAQPKLDYWRMRAAFQRTAFGRSTAGNDVVATIFIRLFFFSPRIFSRFPLSRPFLIEGVLGSKNLFSESCLERPKT